MSWILGLQAGRSIPYVTTSVPDFLRSGIYRFSFTQASEVALAQPYILSNGLSGGSLCRVVLWGASQGGGFFLTVNGALVADVVCSWAFGQTVSVVVDQPSGTITVSGAATGNGVHSYTPWAAWVSGGALVVGSDDGAFLASRTFVGTLSDFEYYVADVPADVEPVALPAETADPQSGLFINHDYEEEEEMAARVAQLPFGLCSHQNESHHFAKWVEAGVNWLRFDIPWDELEGTQGVFLWAGWDNAMSVANALGLKVLLVLGYTPTWANGGNAHRFSQLVGFDGAWQTYVAAVVARYGSQVHAWEVWNEPDLDNFHHAHAGDWAYVNFAGATSTDKNRIQYRHTVDLAMQAGLAGRYCTTSGFAEGGGEDGGMVQWLIDRRGWMDQFAVASFHGYGYSGGTVDGSDFDRLANNPNDYRNYQKDNQYPWPDGFWITEHGITNGTNSDADDKSYLIRSFAFALSQTNVKKLFWFRGGYDPDHRDMLTGSSVRTAIFYAYKLMGGLLANTASVTRWTSSSAQGALFTMVDGSQTVVAWLHNDNPTAMQIGKLGLNIDRVYDQDGATIPTTTTLTTRPVFIVLV